MTIAQPAHNPPAWGVALPPPAAVTLPHRMAGEAPARQPGPGLNQLAVGSLLLELGRPEGAVVSAAREAALPRPLPASARVLPEPIDDLLDRKAETRQLISLLRAGRLVELSGGAGFGKTALLRHLAHHVFTQSFPDGVVYLAGRGRSQADLLQALFAALHEPALGFRATEAQIARALQSRQALVLLDDVAVDEAAAGALLDAAPGCSFVVTATDRQLWGENRALPLLGLQNAVAVKLLEREWGQPIAEEARQAALLLGYFLQGQPLRLRQAAALLREQPAALDGLQAAARAGDPGAALVRRLLETASAPEQQALRALAAAQGAPISPAALAAVTGLEDLGGVLETLQRRGLAVAEGGAYRLPGEAAEAIARLGWDVTAEAERLGEALLQVAADRRWAPDAWQVQAQLVMNVLRAMAARKAWPQAWQLARAVETPLALAQAWGAWGQALQLGLQAARQLGNVEGEAWALHQAGTRALCLGDADGARQALNEALRLRRELGDRVGAALTKHNLGLVLAPGPIVRRSPTGALPKPRLAAPAARPAARGLPRPLALAALVSAMMILVLAGFTGWRWLQSAGAATPIQAAALLTTALPTHTATTPPTEAVTLAAHTPTALPSPTQTQAATATTEWTATTAPTETALPANTATLEPTATAAEPTAAAPTVAASTEAAPALACQVRTDWPVYVVQPGNTLWSVAQAVGSTVGSLAQANCLASTFIYSGQLLRVPRLPAAPTQPATTVPSSTPEPTATTAPTEAPQDAPTEAPTETATEAPTATTVPSSTPEPPTATPVPSDTPAPTAAPTETATEVPTAEPTLAPSDTPEPTAAPTEAPSSTPEPTATGAGETETPSAP